MTVPSSPAIVTVTEPLARLGNSLGEAAIWDIKRQRLHFVDIIERKVFTYDASSGVLGYQVFEKQITALALPAGGEGLFATAEDGVVYIPESSLPFPPDSSLKPFHRVQVPIELSEGFTRFNEACVDPTGNRYLCGTMGDIDQWEKSGKACGGLYAFQPNAGSAGFRAPLALDNITCTNGMGWTSDMKTMYFTDSWTKAIKKYHYDPETGKISNGNVFNNVDDPSLGYPDGLCQDTDGGVWSARWQAGKVVRFNAHGDITLVIEFPRAYNMTSCIFGGPGMDELYVTSASAAISGDSVEQYPDSGHLYVVRGLGYTGEERTRWKAVPPG